MPGRLENVERVDCLGKAGRAVQLAPDWRQKAVVAARQVMERDQPDRWAELLRVVGDCLGVAAAAEGVAPQRRMELAIRNVLADQLVQFRCLLRRKPVKK